MRFARPATSSCRRTSRVIRPAASTGPGNKESDQPLRRLRRHLPMNGEDLVLSLDEGTTGATAVAGGMDRDLRGKGYQEITQHYPPPGWVEHHPNEISSRVQLSPARAHPDS